MGKDLKGKELGKGISQRADGRYIARFTSKTGKRKTLYDFKLNELKRKLREAVYEDEHGLNGNGESITLNAWYVTWTELYKKKTVKMTTIYKNHSYYNSRVKNSIGKMYLQDIKTYHVQKFLNDLIDSGLAHGTVSNIRFMLSDMFDKAVLSEYIRKNPCIGVEMPKEVKKERRVLTREEQEKFFTFASSYIHINVLKFAVTTGCRIGEVLGLKWEDCDFGKREITINKTIHYSKASSPVEGSKFFYTTAKTISSNRVIPMTDEVYEILQNQKIKQTEQKMWKRSIWKQHKEFQNLVFTCSDGSPVYYYNVNSAIKDYVAKINVIEIELAKEEKREPKILELFTCHTLRHTYATRCYENGVDQQVVQKLLGHSTLAMTTDLYTHVSEEKKKEEEEQKELLKKYEEQEAQEAEAAKKAEEEKKSQEAASNSQSASTSSSSSTGSSTDNSLYASWSEKIVGAEQSDTAILNEVGASDDFNTKMAKQEARYQLWDGLLNQMWQDLKASLPEDQMSQLTSAQVDWIHQKEAMISQYWESQNVDHSGFNEAPAADTTKQRVYYLLDYCPRSN